MNQKLLGQVKEVFIPEDDSIYQHTIGFKIKIENNLITITQPQTQENSKIYRDDYVYIISVNINEKNTYTIELVGDKENEHN